MAEQADDQLGLPVLERDRHRQTQSRQGRGVAKRPGAVGMGGDSPGLEGLRRLVGLVSPVTKQHQDVLGRDAAMEQAADLASDHAAAPVAPGGPANGQAHPRLDHGSVHVLTAKEGPLDARQAWRAGRGGIDPRLLEAEREQPLASRPGGEVDVGGVGIRLAVERDMHGPVHREGLRHNPEARLSRLGQVEEDDRAVLVRGRPDLGLRARRREAQTAMPDSPSTFSSARSDR